MGWEMGDGTEGGGGTHATHPFYSFFKIVNKCFIKSQKVHLIIKNVLYSIKKISQKSFSAHVP